jgi:hypothetical protein
MSTTSDPLVFAGPDDLTPQDSAAGWIYLGKRDRRDELTARFGRPPSPLGARLHDQARRLRRPFLDLVAELGRDEKDQYAWWAGTLAWKNPAASDLFLLCCYQALCLELVTEKKPLAVAVEDPWLLSQLWLNLKGNKAVEFRGEASLTAVTLAAATVGLARRVKWLGRMVRSRLHQELHSQGRLPDLAGERRALIYSHLLPRSLTGKWTDHYLTGLDEELTAAGYKVTRVADTDSTGYEKEVSERVGTVFPLILLASPWTFLRAAAAVPPKARTAELDSVSIRVLLRREWWHDFSRAGRCAHLLLKSCLDALFVRARFEACVYPWENQPQERMLLLAAKRAGVRTVACQHTTLPDLMLHFFPGRGEAERAPLPDRLLACGAYPLNKLRQEGFPAEKLLLGGSRRYSPAAVRGRTPTGDEVLALLPLDEEQALKLLAALARLPQPALVKAHPASRLKSTADGPLDAVLARCDAVIFAGTTSGIEAWLAGHPVLRFRSDSLLDVDPCDMLSDADLPTADDWNLPEKLAEIRARPRPPGAAALKALEGLFAPVNKELWLSSIKGTC